MATIYISEQGAVISKELRRLIISKGPKVIFDIPVIKIDRIFIFGNVQLTTQAMAFLLENNIDVSFFTMRYKYKGRLITTESKNIFLRLTQYERYLDREFQLAVARNFVYLRIDGEMDLIYSFTKNYGISRFKNALTALKNCRDILQNKTTIKSIMGVEGIAASYFFKTYKMMIRNERFLFNSRQKNPSIDPVNSLLSFGYTLITNEITSMLYGNGFDPYIGFLHGINYGRPSLALDIVEEFRSLIEGFTLKLINKAILNENDFVKLTDGLFLKNNAMKHYMLHYDNLMNGKNAKSPRKQINGRIKKLKNTIMYKKMDDLVASN